MTQEEIDRRAELCYRKLKGDPLTDDELRELAGLTDRLNAFLPKPERLPPEIRAEVDAVLSRRQHYYEAYESQQDGTWRWKVYHYDASGNREVVIARAERGYDTNGEALDAANEWLDEHDIDAELYA